MSDYVSNLPAQAAVAQWLKFARFKQFAILGDNDHSFLGIKHLIASEKLMQELAAAGRKHYFSEILVMPESTLKYYQSFAESRMVIERLQGLSTVPSEASIRELAELIIGRQYRNQNWRSPETDPVFDRYIADLVFNATKHGITLHSRPAIDDAIPRGSAEWHKKLAEGIKAKVGRQSAFIVFGGGHLDNAHPDNKMFVGDPVKDDLNEYLGKGQTSVLQVYKSPASSLEATLIKDGASINGDGLLRTDRGDAVLYMIPNADQPALSHLVGKILWQRPACQDSIKSLHECSSDTPPAPSLTPPQTRKEKALGKG